MAESIDKAYVKTFESTVRHLAQQNQSRLRNWVQINTEAAQTHVWELLGTGTFDTKSRRSATPNEDTAWSTRMSTAVTYNINDTYEQDDIARLLIDPNSAFATSHAMAMGRKLDNVIIAAATASAADNEGGTTAFLAGQTIGDYTGYISFDMLTNVSELFMNADIDPMEKKCIVIGPKQARKMLQMTEFTSSEYNRGQVAALNAGVGYLPDFMGYEWIVHTGLNAPGANQLDCLAFTKRALGLHLPRDYTTNVAQDPSLQFAWRVYGEFTAGAVRVEDKHIVRLKVNDTAL